MVNIFGISTLAMLVFLIYRRLNNRYQQTVFKNNLFKLRDSLRLLAIEGRVEKNSIEFEYLDHSISKVIEISYYLTLFYAACNEVKHQTMMKDIDEYRDIYDNVNKRLKTNKLLFEIDQRKKFFIHDYLMRQNQITRLFFLYIFHISFGVKRIKDFFRRNTDSINFLPETSGINWCVK